MNTHALDLPYALPANTLAAEAPLARLASLSEQAMTLLLAASLAGAIVIALILLARLVIRDRLRAWVWGALWVIVVLRLLLPWSPSSSVSIHNVQRLAAANLHWSDLSHTTGLEALSNSASDEPSQSLATYPIRNAIADRSTAAQAHTASLDAARSTASPTPSGLAATITSPKNLWTLAAIVWLSGTLIVLSRMVAAWRHARRVVSASHPIADQRLLDLLEDCRAAMRIHRVVALRHTDTPDLAGACVAGIMQPVIILSTPSLRSLTVAELRDVLLHELAHIRRADLAVGWLWGIVLSVHWFNPLAWLAAACMRRDREVACDQAALEATAADQRLGYGRTLLKLAEHVMVGTRKQAGARPAFIAALIGIGGEPRGDGVDARSHMLRRCSMIARFRPSSRLTTALGLCAVSLAALVGLTGPVTGAPPTTSTPGKDGYTTQIVNTDTSAYEMYFKPYEKNANGHIAVPNVQLVALPEYHGVDDTNKLRIIDKRITLVVQDAANSFWPVIMRLSKADAERIYDELDAAARTTLDHKAWAERLAKGDAQKASAILAEVIATDKSRGAAVLNMQQNGAPSADGNMVTLPANTSLQIKVPGQFDHRATIWLTADGTPASWFAVVYADQPSITALRDQFARVLKRPLRREGGDDTLAPKLFTKQVKLNEHSYGDLAPNSSFKVEIRSKQGGQLPWIKVNLIDGASGQVAAQISLSPSQAIQFHTSLTTLLSERRKPSSTTGTMIAGIGAKPYAINDDGSVDLPENIGLTVLPSYHGINLDGKQILDERITIVADDAAVGFWPILARVDDDIARKLSNDISAAMAPKKQ